MPNCPAAPEDRAGAPSEEIEVTPEMIRAGIAVFRSETGDDYSPLPCEGETLGNVYRAMSAVLLNRAPQAVKPAKYLYSALAGG